MIDSNKQEPQKNIAEVTTFPVKFALRKSEESIAISTTNSSKEERPKSSNIWVLSWTDSPMCLFIKSDTIELIVSHYL